MVQRSHAFAANEARKGFVDGEGMAQWLAHVDKAVDHHPDHAHGLPGRYVPH